MVEEEKDNSLVETSKASPKVYSLAEVLEHTKNDSCWIVIHDKVYDVTKFLDEFTIKITSPGDQTTTPSQNMTVEDNLITKSELTFHNNVPTESDLTLPGDLTTTPTQNMNVKDNEFHKNLNNKLLNAQRQNIPYRKLRSNNNDPKWINYYLKNIGQRKAIGWRINREVYL